MVWLPFSHNTALCWCYTLRERAQCLERALVGFTRPVPNAPRATTSWEKGRTRGKKKAAEVLKNIQICCVRLAGSVSSEGQDSPLKWGDELQPWDGLWTVPQPVWATGTAPGSKQRHQPSAFLGPGIYSSCFSRKFRGFGIHKVLLLGWELTHSTKHIH